MHAGQSHSKDVIVISDSDDDDDKSLGDLGDYGEDDWEGADEDNMELWLNNRPAQQNQDLGPGGDVMPQPFPPYVEQPAQNGNGAPEEHVQPTKDECMAQVYTVFPDICPTYVENLYQEHGHGAEANRMLAVICENMEQGRPYPKGESVRKGLKRKRELTATEEAQKTYGAPDRDDDASTRYSHLVRHILSLEFKNTPLTFIDGVLRLKPTSHLFQAYKVLEEAEKTLQESNPRPYRPILKARVMDRRWVPQRLEQTIAAFEADPGSEDELKALRELLAARKVSEEAAEQIAAAERAEQEELLNIQMAEKEGTMKECGCCYGDYPLNRMVHCNSEGDLHWFCRECAKKAVEHVIGNSRYEITCMSMDGCDAGFSRDQMLQFLDEKSFIALDRNEQEAVLRIAGIENLASCPFCPYAAEYPPVEEDKEFRCQAPDCEKVSCRLCKLETHIPKSCEENAKENGLSIRRQIEEAMTAALIRTCNKCGTPFVKELGCNKMTCTRNGCYNVQCYVCSKSCDYNHFNDANRGGKSGNCPLFESAEERHEEEVRRAEAEAIKKVREDHPEYTEDDLRVKTSENVKQDDERRKAMDPRPMARPAFVPRDHLDLMAQMRARMRDHANVIEQNDGANPAFAEDHAHLFGEPRDHNGRRVAVAQRFAALQQARAREQVDLQQQLDRLRLMRQQMQPQPVPQQQPNQPGRAHLMNFANLGDIIGLGGPEFMFGGRRLNDPPVRAPPNVPQHAPVRPAQVPAHPQQAPQVEREARFIAGRQNVVDRHFQRHAAVAPQLFQEVAAGHHNAGRARQPMNAAQQQVPQVVPPQRQVGGQGGGLFQMAAAGANRLGPLGRRAALAFAPPQRNPAAPNRSPGNMDLGGGLAPDVGPRRRQRQFH